MADKELEKLEKLQESFGKLKGEFIKLLEKYELQSEILASIYEHRVKEIRSKQRKS